MTADGEGNFPLLKHEIAQFKMQNRCSFFVFTEFKNNSALNLPVFYLPRFANVLQSHATCAAVTFEL